MLGKFQIGDWVKFNASGKYGYVLYRHKTAGVKIEFGGKSPKFFDPKQITPANDIVLDDEGLHNLQIIALSINDKDWFNEIGRIRNEVNKNPQIA